MINDSRKFMHAIQPLPFPPRRGGWMQIRNYLPHIAAFTILALPAVAFADTYKLLSPLQTPTAEATKEVSNFSTYAKAAFQIVVGMAGLITVVILIIGGIEYVSSGISGNEAARSSAHKRIWDAITGLILALSGFFILNIINPNLANFELKIPEIGSGPAGATGGPATGGLPNVPTADPNVTASQAERTREVLDGTSQDPTGEDTRTVLGQYKVNLAAGVDPSTLQNATVRGLAQSSINIDSTAASLNLSAEERAGTSLQVIKSYPSGSVDIRSNNKLEVYLNKVDSTNFSAAVQNPTVPHTITAQEGRYINTQDSAGNPTWNFIPN